MRDMLTFKGCPRCRGDLHADRDRYGKYIECLQCGFIEDLGKESDASVARIYPNFKLVGDRPMTHILIAEDNVMLRDLLCEIADSILCWTYDVAKDGEEALLLAERETPDVVLSDIDMPRMNGMELARSIKEDLCFSHVPVVLMSSPDREFEALTSGCAAFIPKPFELPALVRVLKRAAQAAQLYRHIG